MIRFLQRPVELASSATLALTARHKRLSHGLEASLPEVGSRTHLQNHFAPDRRENPEARPTAWSRRAHRPHPE